MQVRHGSRIHKIHLVQNLTQPFNRRQNFSPLQIERICRQQIKCYLILSQTSPLFLRVCSTSLLKTVWEKEKLLVTFSMCLLLSPFPNKPFNRRQHFSRLQIESICRQQIKYYFTLSQTRPCFYMFAVQVF